MKKIIIPISVIIIILTVSILGISLIVNNNDTELVQNTVEEISTVEETTSVEETTEEPTTVYEDIVGRDKYITNADRGNSVGEVVENTIEYADTTEKSDTATMNGQLESNTTYEEYAEGTYYIKVNDDGTKEYSPYLITDAMQMEAFSGLSYDEITKVIDTVIDNPKLYGNDEYIRFTIGSLSKRTVNLIVPKEAPVASSGSSSSSSTGNPSSSTGSSTSQQTQQPVVEPSQPETPSQPVVEQPSQPSGNPWLTPEEKARIEAQYATDEAAGDSSDVGGDTGESWSDGRKYN